MSRINPERVLQVFHGLGFAVRNRGEVIVGRSVGRPEPGKGRESVRRKFNLEGGERGGETLAHTLFG